MSEADYIIVSDGACRRNPGPGGWGLIVISPDDRVQELGGHDPETTNNRMEMMGFYEGLRAIFRAEKKKVSGASRIRFITDSKYVIDGAQKYIFNWQRNGWKTASGGEVKNQDLWEKISKGLMAIKSLKLSIRYELVKGHSGHDGNERVDEIAVKYSHLEPIDLYDGPRSEYSVQIADYVPTAPGAKKKTKEVADPASVVYLSFVNGELERHQTWAECSARVTGRSGAKYKKIKNSLEEQETLKKWGMG